MKKTLVILGLVLLPVSMFANSLALIFTDVPYTAWYAESVLLAQSMGIVRGYTDAQGHSTGLFRPEASVSRAEALKMTLTAAGYDYTKYPELTGRKCDHWVCPYLRVTVPHISFSPCGNEKDTDPNFAVDGPMDRFSMARIIADAFGITDAMPSNPEFPPYYHDVDELYITSDAPGTYNVVNPWVYAVLQLTKDGVLSGDTDAQGRPLGTFRPHDSLSRAEAVKMVIKARSTYGLYGAGRTGREAGMIPPCTM